MVFDALFGFLVWPDFAFDVPHDPLEHPCMEGLKLDLAFVLEETGEDFLDNFLRPFLVMQDHRRKSHEFFVRLQILPLDLVSRHAFCSPFLAV